MHSKLRYINERRGVFHLILLPCVCFSLSHPIYGERDGVQQQQQQRYQARERTVRLSNRLITGRGASAELYSWPIIGIYICIYIFCLTHSHSRERARSNGSAQSSSERERERLWRATHKFLIRSREGFF